jgi:hypothetical protein
MPGRGDAFVKTGPVSALDMFEAEVEGLRELALASAIRVPAVIDCGIEDGTRRLSRWSGCTSSRQRAQQKPCWASSWLCCTGTPRSGTAGIVTIRSV